MSGRSWKDRLRFLAPAMPSLLAALVYLNTLPNELAFDDRWTLGRLHLYEGLRPWQLLFEQRGLTYAIHLTDRWLWGDWWFGYHLTNIVLHCTATALVAWMARAMTNSARIGVLCGMIFAVHPVHTEAVASISYRKDLLAMVFVGLAFFFWLRSDRRPWHFAATLLAVGCGIAAKEVAAIGAVPLLFLADLILRRESRASLRRALLRLLPFCLVAVVATVMLAGNLARYFEPQSIHRRVDARLHSTSQVLGTTLASVPDNARLLVFPMKLSADYPLRIQPGLATPRALAGSAIVAAWFALFFLAIRRSPAAAFAIAWVPVMYAPVANLVPLTSFFVAERYLYVPSFGICLLVAMALDKIPDVGSRVPARQFVKFAVPAVLILLLGARTIARNTNWRNAYALWSSSISAGIRTPIVHSGLAVELNAMDRFDESAAESRRALELNPRYFTANVNLGISLAKQGRLADAEAQYRRAIEIRPDEFKAHHNLGIALARQDRPVEAVVEFRRAVEIDPHVSGAHFWLGSTLGRLGQFDESVASLAEAVRLRPDDYQANCDLGISLLALDRFDEARRHLEEAATLEPDYALPYYHLGRLMERRGRPDDALRSYRRCVELVGDDTRLLAESKAKIRAITAENDPSPD